MDKCTFMALIGLVPEDGSDVEFSCDSSYEGKVGTRYFVYFTSASDPLWYWEKLNGERSKHHPRPFYRITATLVIKGGTASVSMSNESKD